VELLRLSYAAIKAADPNAMVISAGLSPTGTSSNEAQPDDTYLEDMYAAMRGNSDGHFDVLGAHGAGFLSSPETDPAVVAADPALGGHRFMAFRHVEDLRAIMVEYGDEDKQVALLEFGWTSDPRTDSPYHWHAVSEEIKADYMVRAYQYAKENWSPWIGVMSLIYVSDPDWTPEDEQYWWSVTDPSYPIFLPRPAYIALKEMEK
jgi:polysaccharide biosynthesis protein PslG